MPERHRGRHGPRARAVRGAPIALVLAAALLVLAGSPASGTGPAGPAGPAGRAGAGPASDPRALPASAPAQGGEPPVVEGSPVGADEANQRAREILDREEFQGPSDGESLIARLREWLRDLLPDADVEGETSRSIDRVAWPLVLVLAGGVGFFLVRFLLRARVGRTPDDEPEGDVEVEVVPLRAPDEWAEEAARCEAAGDWAAAIRARYRALTGTLARRGVIGDQPGRTTGEHRVEVAAAAPGGAAPFATAAGLFERTWYGHHPATADDAHRMAALADTVLAAAPARALVGPAGAADDGERDPGAAEGGHDGAPT